MRIIEKEVYCDNCEKVEIFWWDYVSKKWRCKGNGSPDDNTGECMNSYYSLDEREVE